MSDDGKMDEVPTTVLCSERCHLGEGPTYDAATDTAWWFDIVERRLFEARLGTGQTTIHSLEVMGSALGRIDAQRQLLVADDGLYIRDTADPPTTALPRRRKIRGRLRLPGRRRGRGPRRSLTGSRTARTGRRRAR